MRLSTKRRIATLTIAAAAVIAIQGAVSSAANDATTCPTWHPQRIVADRYQHTWNPQNPLTDQYQHTWNRQNPLTDQYQHSWHPEHVAADRFQHTWNPRNPLTDQLQHSWSWSSVRDHSNPCLLPSSTTT